MREVEGSPRHRMTAGESPKGEGPVYQLPCPHSPFKSLASCLSVCLSHIHVDIYREIERYHRQIYILTIFVFSLQENIQENIIQNLIQEIQTTLANITLSDTQLLLYASFFFCFLLCLLSFLIFLVRPAAVNWPSFFFKVLGHQALKTARD